MNDAKCPFCHKMNDLHTGVDSSTEGPKTGDYMMCLSCGEIGVFTEEKNIRRPDKDETKDILNNASCRRIMAAWLMMAIERNRQK
jgi:hypothetical protein